MHLCFLAIDLISKSEGIAKNQAMMYWLREKIIFNPADFLWRKSS